MSTFRSRFLMVASLAGAAGLLVNVNCGSSGGGGTGGTTGTGGTSSTGGNKGTGGSGTGGSGTGGSGTGGSSTGGSGGAKGGNGGTSATGGSGGAGGAAGAASGGSGGNSGVGGALAGTAIATFDPTDAGASAELDGFVLVTGGTGNLADATDATPAATLTWDGTVGDPAPGSLKIDAPFNAYSEYVNLQRGYASTNTQDWTGKTTLHVRVKIDSGLNPNPNYPPGIQPYVTSYAAPTDGGSASYNYCGNYASAVAGNGWADYTVSLVASSSHCTALDVSKIINFGVQIQTGAPNTGDAAMPADPTPAIIHVDSFSVE